MPIGPCKIAGWGNSQTDRIGPMTAPWIRHWFNSAAEFGDFGFLVKIYQTAGSAVQWCCRWNTRRTGGNKAVGGGGEDEERSGGKSRAGKTRRRGGGIAQEATWRMGTYGDIYSFLRWPLIAIWINCTDHDPLSSDRLPCFMTNGEPSSPLRTTPSYLVKFASSTTSNGGSGRQTRSYDRTDRCVVIRRFVKEEGRITEWSRPIWALSLERKVIKTSNLVKHISWRMQLIFPFWQKGKEVLANVPCGCVFTRATLCVSAVFAVERWLPVCLSVCHTPLGLLCLNG